jgi:hypothetical protein
MCYLRSKLGKENFDDTPFFYSAILTIDLHKRRCAKILTARYPLSWGSHFSSTTRAEYHAEEHSMSLQVPWEEMPATSSPDNRSPLQDIPMFQNCSGTNSAQTPGSPTKRHRKCSTISSTHKPTSSQQSLSDQQCPVPNRAQTLVPPTQRLWRGSKPNYSCQIKLDSHNSVSYNPTPRHPGHSRRSAMMSLWNLSIVAPGYPPHHEPSHSQLNLARCSTVCWLLSYQ